MVNVDYWNYTKENDDKVAKVDMGIKMIDAASGKILWKAGHHEVEAICLSNLTFLMWQRASSKDDKRDAPLTGGYNKD